MRKEEFGTYSEGIKPVTGKRPLDVDDKEIVDELMSDLDDDRDEIQNGLRPNWRKEDLLRDKYPKD